MIFYKIVFDKIYFACIIKHVSNFSRTRRGKSRLIWMKRKFRASDIWFEVLHDLFGWKQEVIHYEHHRFGSIGPCMRYGISASRRRSAEGIRRRILHTAWPDKTKCRKAIKQHVFPMGTHAVFLGIFDEVFYRWTLSQKSSGINKIMIVYLIYNLQGTCYTTC